MSHSKTFVTNTLSAANKYLTSYLTLKFPPVFYEENRIE